LVLGQTIKIKDRQYFRLYSSTYTINLLYFSTVVFESESSNVNMKVLIDRLSYTYLCTWKL